MLTTHRRDQRTRRQARFTLETLDDRLVLSAAAAGAAAEAAVVAHHHHGAKLARAHVRHEARLAALAAVHSMPSAAVALPVTGGASASATSASAGASASAMSSAPAATPTPSSSGNAVANSPIPAPVPTPSPQPSPGPLPASVAAALQSLYTEFQKAGGGSFTPSQPSDKMLQISGSSVEVSLKVGSGTDFNTALSQLQADGMQVSSSSASYGLIDGMLPISQLPAAAAIASSVNSVPPPTLF